MVGRGESTLLGAGFGFALSTLLRLLEAIAFALQRDDGPSSLLKFDIYLCLSPERTVFRVGKISEIQNKSFVAHSERSLFFPEAKHIEFQQTARPPRFGAMQEPVDEGDDAGGIGKDLVPFPKGFIDGQNGGRGIAAQPACERDGRVLCRKVMEHIGREREACGVALQHRLMGEIFKQQWGWPRAICPVRSARPTPRWRLLQRS